MKGRMLASVVMTAIGASLLAAAMFASTASGAGAGSATATAKKGGSLTLVNRSDFDYVDPGLAYFQHSWNMMSATNLTLLYYPHTEGPARNRLAGMAAPQLAAAFHAVAIEVEGVDPRAEAASCEAEEPAARPDVEEGPAGQRGFAKHRGERCFGPPDARLVDDAQELSPVAAEFESIAALHFVTMRRARCQSV